MCECALVAKLDVCDNLSNNSLYTIDTILKHFIEKDIAQCLGDLNICWVLIFAK